MLSEIFVGKEYLARLENSVTARFEETNELFNLYTPLKQFDRYSEWTQESFVFVE